MNRFILILALAGCAPAWRDPSEAYGPCHTTCPQGQSCITSGRILGTDGQIWESGFCGTWCEPWVSDDPCRNVTLTTPLTPTCFGPVNDNEPRLRGVCAFHCVNDLHCPVGLVCRNLRATTGVEASLCLPPLVGR